MRTDPCSTLFHPTSRSMTNGTYDYTKWSPGMTTTGGDAPAAVSATAAGAEQLPVRPHQCGSALLRGRLLGRHAPRHHRLRGSRRARMSLTLPAFLLWHHIAVHSCPRALAGLACHGKLKDGGKVQPEDGYISVSPSLCQMLQQSSPSLESLLESHVCKIKISLFHCPRAQYCQHLV